MDNMESGNDVFWEDLKQKLDDELTLEELKRVLYLLKDQFITGMIPERDIQHPSDLLNILENNMPMEDALSIVQHVFSAMDTYPEYESKSFGQLITDHMNVRKYFGCPNIIGRERKIEKASMWLKSPDTKGIWIHGAGGLGKTLLASAICLKLFYGDVTIITVDLKHVTTAEELVRSILSKFDLDVTHSDLQNPTLELIHQLKNVTHDTCIVLDNAENVYKADREEVTDILCRFWNSSEDMLNIKWIVTAREAMETEKVARIKLLKLKPLHREYAEKLLRQSCRMIELSEGRCQMLLEMAGGVPLAIRLLSSALMYTQSSIDDNNLREILNMQLQNFMRDCIQYSYSSLSEQEKHQLHMLSVIETTQFDIDIVKAVLEITEKEAFVLMMNLTSRYVVQRVHIRESKDQPQKSSICLQYSIHPIIFEYIHNLPFPQECTGKAQSSFCKHMLQRIEPSIANSDFNYKEAMGNVSSNRPLLKIMCSLLSLPQIDIEHLSTSNANICLHKVHDMLHLSQPEKERFYRNLIDKMKTSGRKRALFFWELELVRMMVDSEQFCDAEAVLLSLEKKLVEMVDGDFCIYLKGRFWYNKGRFFRCKRVKELNKATECFKKSREILQDTQYVSEEIEALDAIGNTYFDERDYDNSLLCHLKAAAMQRAVLSGKDHPNIVNYDFNVGTIYLAKACQDLKTDKTEARHNFEKALEIFQDSMAKDEQLGTCQMSQYGSKLLQRAQTLFYLDRHENAISDLKRSLEIKLRPFIKPDKKRTSEYFRYGRLFLEWREELQLQRGSAEISRLLLRETLQCFEWAKDEMKLDRKAWLTGPDQSNFTVMYRDIAKNVGRSKRKSIYNFCEGLENGRVEADSRSSSSSSGESNSSSPKYSDSGGGFSLDEKVDKTDEGSDDGIPCVKSQKQQALQYEQEILAKMNSEVVQTKKRHRSLSESD